uniref:Uncharacterized protein n=1 Tax=Clastoptera arizonana TaxID=38151 RepID=A0A1B6C668_9HEMI
MPFNDVQLIVEFMLFYRSNYHIDSENWKGLERSKVLVNNNVIVLFKQLLYYLNTSLSFLADFLGISSSTHCGRLTCWICGESSGLNAESRAGYVAYIQTVLCINFK